LHSLYGKQVASHLVSFAAEDLDFSVSGFVSKPEVTRSSRSYFTIILNGRFVRSIPITQAVLKAFGTLLPNGRFPVGVLHIRVDPKLVDVNVHPSKLEVRLSKEAECCRLVEQAVAEAFRKQFLVPAAGKPGGRKAEAEERFVQGRLSWDVPAGKVVREPAASFTGEAVRENLLSRSEAEKAGEPTAMRENELNELNPAVSARGEKISSSVLRSPPPGSRKADLEEPFFRPSIEPGSSHLRNTAKHSRSVDSSDVCTPSDAQTKPLEEKGFPIPSGGEQASPDVSLRRIPEMMPLAQIHGTYIVAQAEDGFYLLDQHAAHERIYYEKFYRELGNPEPKRQQLLLPLTVECSPAEAETVTSQLSRLREWGLEIEPFGGTTFVVRAVPHWFPAGEEESLIRDVIDFLMQHGKVETAKLRDAGAKMMACKAAIKANRHLRRDEMEKLLEQLNLCDNPFTCPHGRPIFVHFSTHELEKMFKRVM
jgi:DNA mismatch repair protein MutL